MRLSNIDVPQDFQWMVLCHLTILSANRQALESPTALCLPVAGAKTSDEHFSGGYAFGKTP